MNFCPVLFTALLYTPALSLQAQTPMRPLTASPTAVNPAPKPSPAAAPLMPPAPSGVEVVTLKGEKLQNARVLSVDPDGISYAHSRGVAKIPFEDLPEQIRKQHGYNPMAAARFAEADAIAQQRAFTVAQAETVKDQQRQRRTLLTPARRRWEDQQAAEAARLKALAEESPEQRQQREAAQAESMRHKKDMADLRRALGGRPTLREVGGGQ